MKQLFLIFLFANVFISCKTTIADHDIEIKDTELAPVAEYTPVEITSADFLRLVERFAELRKAFKENSLADIVRLSLDTLYCPSYDLWNDEYEGGHFVTLRSFVRAPFRQVYQSKYLDYADTAAITMARNISTNTGLYIIRFRSEEKYKKFTARLGHVFSFVKIGDEFKFYGFEVHGSFQQDFQRPVDTSRLYFPLNPDDSSRIDTVPALQPFINRRFSEVLDTMREVNIYKYKGEDEIYRFSWYRSFHNDIAITVRKKPSGVSVTTTELYGPAGYDGAGIRTHTIRELSDFDWAILKAKFDLVDFLKMTVHDPEPAAMDGAQWVLEVFKKGKYHFAVRQFPRDNYRKFCAYFIFLSQLYIPQDEIY